LLAWLISYGNNRGDLTSAMQATSATRKVIDATPFAVSADVVPASARTRRLARAAVKVAPEDVSWSHGFGLYQGRRLGNGSGGFSYDQLLADTLPPRLTARIEQQLRSSGANLDALYEALKATSC